MAKAKNTTTALAKYDERLAALAKRATDVEASVGSAGNFLSIRGGVLSYQGVQVPGNKMSVVILESILENQWYDQPFDPNNPSSPACYAFGYDQKTMVPHAQAAMPQSEACASCEMMKFGSADRGKGKACKACQRIALITEGDLEHIESAEIAYLKLPFFSTVEYAAFVRLLAEQYKRPPLAFITEITVVPDPKSQFRVKFHMTDKIEDGNALGLLLDLQAKAQAEINFPYPEAEAPAEEPQKRRQAPARPQAAAAPRKPAARRQQAAPEHQAQAAAAGVAGKPVVGLRRGVKPTKY